MQLTRSEHGWCPEDQEQYLCLWRDKAPQSAAELLNRQVDLLALLQKQASPRELQQANRQLQWALPEEQYLFLPDKLLEDPRLPDYLLRNPAPELSPLGVWRSGLQKALKSPLVPEVEANRLLQGVSLESFLQRVL